MGLLCLHAVECFDAVTYGGQWCAHSGIFKEGYLALIQWMR